MVAFAPLQWRRGVGLEIQLFKLRTAGSCHQWGFGMTMIGVDLVCSILNTALKHFLACMSAAIT